MATVAAAMYGAHRKASVCALSLPRVMSALANIVLALICVGIPFLTCRRIHHDNLHSRALKPLSHRQKLVQANFTRAMSSPRAGTCREKRRARVLIDSDHGPEWAAMPGDSVADALQPWSRER